MFQNTSIEHRVILLRCIIELDRRRRSRSERLQSIANDVKRTLPIYRLTDFLEDAFEEDILSTNELRLFFTGRKGSTNRHYLWLVRVSVLSSVPVCVVIVVSVERKKDLEKYARTQRMPMLQEYPDATCNSSHPQEESWETVVEGWYICTSNHPNDAALLVRPTQLWSCRTVDPQCRDKIDRIRSSIRKFQSDVKRIWTIQKRYLGKFHQCIVREHPTCCPSFVDIKSNKRTPSEYLRRFENVGVRPFNCSKSGLDQMPYHLYQERSSMNWNVWNSLRPCVPKLRFGSFVPDFRS